MKSYPCDYDPTDVPFAYFPSTRDKDGEMKDFDTDFAADLAAGTLPPVAFVKGIGYKTEHPGGDITISAGVTFVKGVVDAIAASPEASSTLVLVTWDEGGGFFDHVAPPATSTVDNQPYGTRVPLIAAGPFVEDQLRLARDDGALVDRQVHRVELARRRDGPARRARRARQQPRRFPGPREDRHHGSQQLTGRYGMVVSVAAAGLTLAAVMVAAPRLRTTMRPAPPPPPPPLATVLPCAAPPPSPSPGPSA